jgi:hypothetical protein
MERQPPPANAAVIDHDDALDQIGRSHPLQNFAHPGDDCGVAPIAIPKQDQA